MGSQEEPPDDPLRAPIIKAADAAKTAASTSADAVRDAAKAGLKTVGAPVPTALRSAGEAEMSKWKSTFNSVAKTGPDGERYLDKDGFVKALVPKGDFHQIGRDQYAILFRVADTSRNGKVTLDQFIAFESLLMRPDADYSVAWQLFDSNHDGSISFDEFRQTFMANISPSAIPFDFDTPWIKLYLGKRGTSGQHVLGYNEFAQLMKGLQGERLRQAFKFFDKAETGYIQPADFARIIRELAGHKLSPSVLERLPTLCQITSGGKISYSEVRAFNNIVHDMDAVENVIRTAAARSKDGRISQADFATEAAHVSRYGVFTPLEIATLWHFASPGKDGRLALRDFGALLDPKWQAPEFWEPEAKVPFLTELGRSAWSFGLGGIAGGLGASVVYPIDLVKTRMQNQRSKVVGEMLYRNATDCYKKVYRNEGLLGFYRGLPPQLVGVAPEKAIKLTVNDLIRRKARDPDSGRITLPWEIVAGAGAGASQVVFTNPLEIVKIRLQMQGEAARSAGAKPHGALVIVKQLGLTGLYKGAAACMLRDAPFSAIYFTAYAHLRTDVFHEGRNGKKLGYGETLLAATLAGSPSAWITTPADVIKTRLQTAARKGETVYSGILDCGRKILSEEGPRALMKGGLARVLRSSPQFGVTLLSYETLKAALPYPFMPQKAATAIPDDDITRVRARNALRILLDVHPSFGTAAAP